MRLKRTSLIISLFFFSFFLFVIPTFAEDINITDWDRKAGENLGLSGGDAEIAGGLLIATVLELVVLLPVAFLTKGRSLEALLVFGTIPLCFCIAVSWLPSFVLLIVVLLIVALLGRTIAGAFKG